MKIKKLNKLATEMVGDSGKPNVYFVTEKGDVILVTTSFSIAHTAWQRLASERVESALEDRQNGVIADGGIEEGGSKWRVHDDSISFGFRNSIGDYIR